MLYPTHSPSLPYPPLYRRQHKISLQFRTQFVGPRTRAMSPRIAVERSSASVRMSVCPHVRMSISVWLCVGSHQLKAITMSAAAAAAAAATGCPSKLKALFVAALFPSLSARQRRKHACNCNLLFRLSLALSSPPPLSRSSCAASAYAVCAFFCEKRRDAFGKLNVFLPMTLTKGQGSAQRRGEEVRVWVAQKTDHYYYSC